MYKIKYTREAFADIKYIFEYSNASIKFAKKFYKTIDSILIFPYGGISYSLKNYSFRKTRIGKYIIFYIVDEKNEEILT